MDFRPRRQSAGPPGSCFKAVDKVNFQAAMPYLTDTPLPRMRSVEVIPIDRDGSRMFYVRDPLEIAPQPLLLGPAGMLDGFFAAAICSATGRTVRRIPVRWSATPAWPSTRRRRRPRIAPEPSGSPRARLPRLRSTRATCASVRLTYSAGSSPTGSLRPPIPCFSHRPFLHVILRLLRDTQASRRPIYVP